MNPHLQQILHDITVRITKLEEAQEPVKLVKYNCTCGKTMTFESVHGIVAPQRTWVGLTDEERKTICEANNVYHDGLIEDIEAKLKEKNNDVF